MRLVLLIDRTSDLHTHCGLMVDGNITTGKCGITLRTSQVISFIDHIKPDRVEANSENINMDLYRRLAGYKRPGEPQIVSFR